MSDNQDIRIKVTPSAPNPSDKAVPPLVDIHEEEDGAVVLTVEIPGADKDKVDVRVDKGVLTIWADGQDVQVPEEYAPTYVGFAGSEYFRAFALSDEVDRDNIQAKVADGLLTLRLPRASAAQTKKIEIKAG